ncbi:MAG: TPM domain-containing protein [Treponema sp.]|jgi:uncharacterized protein|nr:TPM domain-containing protein [Treponema sp.]
MKKTFLLIFISAALFLLPAVLLFSQSAAVSRVVDNAGLLNDDEIAWLESLTAKIASAYNFDLVIVTEAGIGSAASKDYADDFFERNGYGFGAKHDGCLMLHVKGDREYWFSTSGRGITILNDTAFDKLESDVVGFLKRDDFAGAYHAFISDWEKFLVLDAKGKSYNFFRAYGLYLHIGAWIFSFIIALFVVYGMKTKMETIFPLAEADCFMIPGSLAFTQKNDGFLYSKVTKTMRQSSSGSGSGSRTGSSSSSGRSHGGGGGRY